MLGGGIAGCAAALALGDRGIDDVLVVEAGTYDGFQVGETIPPDTRLLLERLRLRLHGREIAHGDPEFRHGLLRAVTGVTLPGRGR